MSFFVTQRFKLLIIIAISLSDNRSAAYIKLDSICKYEVKTSLVSFAIVERDVGSLAKKQKVFVSMLLTYIDYLHIIEIYR